MTTEWRTKWNYQIRPTKAPGVYETPDGFLVHGKVTVHGRPKRVMRVVQTTSLREAQRARLALLDEKKSTKGQCPRFSEYAPSLYSRKVAQREIKSAKTRERWDTTLRLHLLPAFGRFPVDAIGKIEIEQWKTSVSSRIPGNGKKRLSPRTANGWLSILRVILRAAVDDYQLDKDPTLRVRDFSTVEHPTYTEEKPNALTPAQCQAFLSLVAKLYPQHYAMVLLGFVTGLRPSTMRAIRRRGREADLRWDEGTLSVRRSNSLGSEVMNATKSGTRYTISLPKTVLAELRAHADSLVGKMARSILLFPAETGGFRTRSVLDKPFQRVSKKLGLGFALTPRGMRRTYQDLGRAQGVEKNVRRAICGHEDEKMSKLYETVTAPEMRAAVEAIAALATGRAA